MVSLALLRDSYNDILSAVNQVNSEPKYLLTVALISSGLHVSVRLS